jgi:hypothetical protein
MIMRHPLLLEMSECLELVFRISWCVGFQMEMLVFLVKLIIVQSLPPLKCAVTPLHNITENKLQNSYFHELLLDVQKQ